MRVSSVLVPMEIDTFASFFNPYFVGRGGRGILLIGGTTVVGGCVALRGGGTVPAVSAGFVNRYDRRWCRFQRLLDKSSIYERSCYVCNSVRVLIDATNLPNSLVNCHCFNKK